MTVLVRVWRLHFEADVPHVHIYFRGIGSHANLQVLSVSQHRVLVLLVHARSNFVALIGLPLNVVLAQ